MAVWWNAADALDSLDLEENSLVSRVIQAVGLFGDILSLEDTMEPMDFFPEDQREDGTGKSPGDVGGNSSGTLEIAKTLQEADERKVEDEETLQEKVSMETEEEEPVETEREEEEKAEKHIQIKDQKGGDGGEEEEEEEEEEAHKNQEEDGLEMQEGECITKAEKEENMEEDDGNVELEIEKQEEVRIEEEEERKKKMESPIEEREEEQVERGGYEEKIEAEKVETAKGEVERVESEKERKVEKEEEGEGEKGESVMEEQEKEHVEEEETIEIEEAEKRVESKTEEKVDKKEKEGEEAVEGREGEKEVAKEQGGETEKKEAQREMEIERQEEDEVDEKEEKLGEKEQGQKAKEEEKTGKLNGVLQDSPPIHCCPHFESQKPPLFSSSSSSSSSPPHDPKFPETVDNDSVEKENLDPTTGNQSEGSAKTHSGGVFPTSPSNDNESKDAESNPTPLTHTLTRDPLDPSDPTEVPAPLELRAQDPKDTPLLKAPREISEILDILEIEILSSEATPEVAGRTVSAASPEDGTRDAAPEEKAHFEKELLASGSTLLDEKITLMDATAQSVMEAWQGNKEAGPTQHSASKESVREPEGNPVAEVLEEEEEEDKTRGEKQEDGRNPHDDMNGEVDAVDGKENGSRQTSKYKTVSYRRIRKGNTRQRIDEFESMINS